MALAAPLRGLKGDRVPEWLGTGEERLLGHCQDFTFSRQDGTREDESWGCGGGDLACLRAEKDLLG